MDGPARSVRPGTVRAVGDAAVVIEVEGPDTARALVAAVAASAPPGVVEVVAGLSSVLVALDAWSAETSDLDEVAGLLARLAALGAGAGVPSPPRSVTLPVRFGGPDTDTVCRLAGVGPKELAELLGGAVLRVVVVGFSPGFAYLDGVPAVLGRVGRLESPRPAVPPGSVAVAGGLAAVYPQATPGGWHLVGRTSARLFDPATPPYALLRAGDRVRLEPVEGESPGAVDAEGGGGNAGGAGSSRPPLRPPAGSRAALAVERPGVLTLVQDGGRTGVATIGVPAAGPADPVAHRLANRLVGNRGDAAALEVLVSGPLLRAECDLHVAVVGEADVRVDGRPVRTGHVVPLAPGQHLAVGAVSPGARAYVAIGGGFDVPAVLGSRSTDVLSWFGPGALASGDRLGVADDRVGPPADHLRPAALDELRATVGWTPASGGSGPGPGTGVPVHRVLRVMAGPHEEWFDGEVLDRLASGRFVVGAASDRVGLRLEALGPAATAVSRRTGELTSQPTTTGAVQVPPDGLPVVLGPDHATLGGYPVVAVVVAADRWALGQCRAGDTVAFRPVGREEAVAALVRLRRLVAGAVVGTYPVTAG